MNSSLVSHTYYCYGLSDSNSSLMVVADLVALGTVMSLNLVSKSWSDFPSKSAIQVQ